jgi:uncharacterized membrane protein
LNWSRIRGYIFGRLVPVKTIEALIYEGIGLAALLISFHLIQLMIRFQVDDQWVKDALSDAHGAFVIIYFVIFGVRLGQRLLFEGTNAIILVA